MSLACNWIYRGILRPNKGNTGFGLVCIYVQAFDVFTFMYSPGTYPKRAVKLYIFISTCALWVLKPQALHCQHNALPVEIMQV